MFVPEDEGLSSETKSQIQVHRLLTLLAAGLILLFGLVYARTNPSATDPVWARAGVIGMLIGLVGGSYAWPTLRQNYVVATWGACYLLMGWFTILTILNDFAPNYAVGLLLTYAGLAGVVALGAQSSWPVAGFSLTGLVLTGAGLYYGTPLRTDPLILMVSLATFGISESVIAAGWSSVRDLIANQRVALQEERDRLIRHEQELRDAKRAAEEANRRLQRQRRRLRRTQEVARVGGWEYDRASDTLEATEWLLELVGLGPDADLSRAEAFQFFLPEARARIADAVDRCVAEAEPFDLEVPFVSESGDQLWVRARGEPETTDATVTRVVGTFQDITDRKQQQERLRSRRRKVESLYDASKRLLTAESPEAVSDSIHEVLRDVFDYELRNTGFIEGDQIVPLRTEMEHSLEAPRPDPQPTSGSSLSARALSSGKVIVENDVQRLDNEVDYGNLQSAAAMPVGNRGVIVVGQTETQTFDAFNLRLIEILGTYAALVLDRLGREGALVEAKEQAEAARAEAEAARRKAEAANRAKSAFLANMSHEIRTPLTSIIGFAEAIGEETEKLEAEQGRAGTLNRFSALIERSGHSLLETLDGVLNLSKLEAEQIDMDARPVNLSAEVAAVVEELAPQAEAAGVELTVDTDATVRATADKGGVQIVTRNLLSNAIKYTEAGGTVKVRTYPDDGAAVLEVADSGVGMDPEATEHIFEPFWQGVDGRASGTEGTGLGLALVSRAIRTMDGRIDVATEPGQGTTFTVRLPRADRTAPSRDER